MSARIFQSVIVQMKEVTDRVFGVIDADGTVQACSALNLVGSEIEGASMAILASGKPATVHDGKTFCVLGGQNARFDYAAFVKGRTATPR